MNEIKSLSKDVTAIINPPIWNSYYYVSVQLRKAYEREVPKFLEQDKKYDILDYGCGSKPYKYLFKKNINRYAGVDVGDNPHADFKIEPGQKLDFVDNSYDIIISSQVLEHVQDVDSYMSECYRVLRPNGLLLLSTHGTWQYHAAPYDFQRWTSIGLKHLMTRFNFETIGFHPVLGQLAVTSQLRLSFYNSFASMLGVVGKILLAPIAVVYQIKMMIEDAITPQRVKERDSAIFLLINKKK